MSYPASIIGQTTIRRNFRVLDNLTAGKVKADLVKGETVENNDGLLEVNDITAKDTNVHIEKEKGVYTIGVDRTIPNFPLYTEDIDNSISLAHTLPLANTENGLTLLYNEDNLTINENNELSVVFQEPETLKLPLIRDETGIGIRHDESLKVNHGMLGLDYNDPLFIDMQSKLTIDHDTSLRVDGEGKLGVVPEFIDSSVQTGKGLQVNDDGELQTDLNNIIKPLGALHANGLFDLADDVLEYGYETISEIFGDGKDTSVKLLRLKTLSDFTQKGILSGSKVLSIKNKGASRIPYYATISDEFETDDTFRYNSTLNELKVGHVSLNNNFNPNNDEAVTAAYAEQLYQSETGSPIDVSALSNGWRTLGLRTDATLAVENQVLSVNVTPLVNGSSVKIDGNGKIASGLIFQPANGVRLREGTNNDVQLSLDVEGALEKVGLNKIKENMTFSRGLQRTENNVSLDLKSANSQILWDAETGTITGNIEVKANSGLTINENIIDIDKSARVDGSTLTVHNGKITANLYHFGDGFQVDTQIDGNNTVNMQLEAGEGIAVAGNRISVTPYTAGQNVSISNRTISMNIPEETPYSGGAGISVSGKTISNTLNISAGMGTTVSGSAAFGYIISSQNLKQSDDDGDDKTQDDQDDRLQNENSKTVSTSSPVSTILPFPLIPFPPPPSVIPLVPIFPFIGALPALLGTLGGFAVIFGYQRERKKKKNPDGTDQLNEQGNPIFDTGPDGDYIWSEGSNVAIQSDKITRRTRLLMDDWPDDVRVGYWASVMNLSKTWEFFEKIIQPWSVDTLGTLIEPIDNRLLTAESRLTSTENSIITINNNHSNLGTRVGALEVNSPISVGKGLVKNSKVISINPYQVESIKAIDDIVLGMQRFVPSTVFFTDSEPSTTTVVGEAWGDGAYTISTSHTDNMNRGHKAFANWGSSLWFTNLYTGAGGTSSRTTETTVAGVLYKGEWIQIQLPSAKSISATRLRYRNGGNILGIVQTFAILGSNDGTTWNLIYHQSTPAGWDKQNREPKWFPSTNTAAYSYIRLVCLTNGGGGGYAYCGVRIEYFTPIDAVTINKHLLVGNGITANTATFSQTVSAATPTVGAHLTNKTFTDTTYATIASLGTTNSNLTALTTRVSSAETSLTGKQNTLSVASGNTLTNNVIGYDTAVIGTKASVDVLTTRVSSAETSLTGKQNTLSVASGITLTNNVIGYDVAVIGTKASVDALATQISSAETSLTGKQNTLSVASGITLTNNIIGYDAAVIGTKASVDALSTSKQDLLTAGTGLTKTGATLYVNPTQMQITSVGTLTALSVNGYINITNTGSVALSIADNVSFGRCGANTQWFSNAQTGDAIIRASGSKVIRLGTNTNASIVDIFDGGMVVNSGNLTVATAPTLGNHLVNKTYVDGSFASIGSLTTTNTNVTNLTGRVVSLETGGTTSKEITVWSKIKGSDTVPVPLPPVGGAALMAGTSTPTTWEHLNGTYTLTASSIYSAGYEAYRGFKSERLTAPWVSGSGSYNSTTGVYTTSTASWIDNNSTFVPGEWVAVELPAARTVSAVTI
ncbi:TPA_asm: fiber [Powellomyces chytrid fungus MELD virus 4]|nr:TPA_asm: fiber [Powellomyces chytrid fungus MELD virus 4]